MEAKIKYYVFVYLTRMVRAKAPGWTDRTRLMNNEFTYHFWLLLPCIAIGLLASVPFVISHDNHFIIANLWTWIVFIPVCVVNINKDIFDDRSVMHRILGYKVVRAADGAAAGPVRCATRNITILIWPLEVLMATFSSRRRLGDYLAGTTLVRVPPSDPALILDDVRTLRWTASMWGVLAVNSLIVLAIMLFGICNPELR